MDNKNEQKRANEFCCKMCNYITSRKTNYSRHIQTKKHLDNNDNKNEQKRAKNICKYCNKTYMYYTGLIKHQKICEHKKKLSFYDNNDNKQKMSFLCHCGNHYLYQSGLSRHKQVCNFVKSNNSIIMNNKINDENKELKNLIKELILSNKELQEDIIKVAKEPKIINNNTQFNIMNYLNNDCKDAMNLSDFINELPFSLNDLEIMGTKGYQQSMEDTFIKQLTIMDKTKRPIHCSDKKRKSFYIKENDVWEKNEDNSKIVNGFKKLSQKHLEILNSWTHYNKNWSFNERKQNFFNRSVQEVAKYNDSKQINKLICKLTGLTIR
jgi:hypothetical protein